MHFCIRLKNMCLNPKWIYKKGNYKENNYRGAKGEFYELGTYSKCGYCEQCISEKCNNWVVRCYYEAKKWQKICFITLTYKNNPIIVNLHDVQKFMKRLRVNLKRNGYNEKIRMFGALEYGSINSRPHAHIIIFNWTDNNAKYVNINKKGNTVYKSDIIEKTWGLGITSYQEFGTHEIPYIAIYNTPAETFSKAYKLTLKKCNEIKAIYKNYGAKNPKRAKDLLKQINEYEKILKKSKQEYLLIKERNIWSIGLGWEEFYDEYSKSENYVFEEYIEDKSFVTPTPWVKKLANLGYIDAAEEMFKRESLIQTSENEEEERRKNLTKILQRRKKEIIDYKTKKDEIEVL